MTLTPRIRRALFAGVGLLFLWLAWTGVTQAISQVPESHTPGELAQTLTQLAFGLFALLSLLTVFRGRRWNTVMLGGWTVSVTLAATLASVVWGGTSLPVGLLAGAATLLVGLGMAWLLRMAARELLERPVPSQPAGPPEA